MVWSGNSVPSTAQRSTYLDAAPPRRSMTVVADSLRQLWYKGLAMQLLCASASGEIVEIGRLLGGACVLGPGNALSGNAATQVDVGSGFAGETQALMAVRAKEHV